MPTETKYSAYSLLSLLSILVLHAIHYMLLPVMIGTMEMESQHAMNHMNTADSGSGSIFTLLFILLNGIGLYFGGKLLWSTWKKRRKGWHTFKCISISVASIVISIVSLFVIL